MRERLRIGVSACLTGQAVRFDGGHKRDDFVAALAAELVPVCPEVELGLGTPRETLRLVRRPSLALVSASGRDRTNAMRRFAAARVAELGDLDGFIVKKDSPSCGLARVRVYGAGLPERNGRGLFTEALTAAWPLLPVEEEGRLRDAGLRERFLLRVAVWHEVRTLFASPWRLGQLVALHASLKLDLLAASPAAQGELGRLVAHGRRLERGELALRYATTLMRALAIVPTRGRHTNVLQHVAGYFSVSADERRELRELIDDYAAGRAPRESPLVLLRHHARRGGHRYLSAQTYLQRSVS